MPNELTKFILNGAYINNDAGTDHDLEEAFPEKADDIFLEKGWRVIDGKVMSPDDINGSNKTNPDLLQILDALKEAKKTIRGWHGMGAGDPRVEQKMWQIYETQAPEMKRLNSAIQKAKQLCQ